MNPASPISKHAFLVTFAVAALLLAAGGGMPALAQGGRDVPEFEDLNQQGQEGDAGTVRGQEQDGRSYERVDGGNQDGSGEARDHLARVIGTSPVGYDRARLARVGRQDLLALDQWFNQIEGIAPKFLKNAEDAGKHLSGPLTQQTIHSVYEARTKGLFDKQSDKDDFRVVRSFLTYTRDQVPPSPLLNSIADKVVALIVAAGPAYKVPITAEEARDPARLSEKFTRDLDKGATQFAAAYLQSLVIDKPTFEAAGRLSLIPPQAVDEMNRPPTRSDFDNGAGRQEGGADFAELVTARQGLAEASRQREMAERAFQEGVEALGRPSGPWTREALLEAIAAHPDVNTMEITNRYAGMTRARQAEAQHQAALAKMEQEGVAAVERGTTLTQRYEQLREALGALPQGVELSGPLAEHRRNLEQKLQQLKERNLGNDFFTMRGNPEMVARIVNYESKVAKAVTYQLEAEARIKQLSDQRRALNEAVTAFEVPANAPAEFRQQVQEARRSLEQQSSAGWERKLWEQTTTQGVRAETERISQEMVALGEKLKTLAEQNSEHVERDRADAAIADAYREAYRANLRSSEVEETTLASPVRGKVLPSVRSRLLVLDRKEVHVGGLPAATETEIVGFLHAPGELAELMVLSYRIKIPEANRTAARVTEGFVPPKYFGPLDENELKEAVRAALAARAGAGSGEGDEGSGDGDVSEEGSRTTSPAATAGPAELTDEQKRYELAVAKTRLWTTFQRGTADLESGNLAGLLDWMDYPWPSDNEIAFHSWFLVDIMRSIGTIQQLTGQKVPEELFNEFNQMSRYQKIGSMGSLEDFRDRAFVHMKKVEMFLQSRDITAPPASYAWGRKMQSIGPR